MKGTFLVTVTDHILATSKNTQTPSVKLTLGIIKCITDPEDRTKGQLYHDLWLTDKPFERTMKTLHGVLGWQGDDISELNGTGILCDKELWAEVDEETYEGKTYSKVQWLNPVGGGVKIERMEDASAKALAEKLKGKILNYRQNAPETDGLPF